MSSITLNKSCLEKMWSFNTQANPFSHGPIKPISKKGDSIVVSVTESSIYSKSNSESILPSLPDEEK